MQISVETENSIERAELMYQAAKKEIFHVHTWRCKHSSMEEDFLYVEKAIALGADRIVFTDHSPFPGNPFGKRMDMEQYPEYIKTLYTLKKEYSPNIEVLVGLEMEYLPSFHSFYKELHASKELDLMILGQHFYENADGSWSFQNEDKSKEYIGLCEALVKGAETGFFDVIAHPDRVFHRCKEWNAKMQRLSLEVINAAVKNDIVMEQNYSSMQRKRQYWEQFWENTDGNVGTIKGYDAHSVDRMTEIWNWKHSV